MLALAGIGLILFQMFIVGAFRTYRYELYDAEKRRDQQSPAIDLFRKPTGVPWAIYCGVAFVATWPWLFALAKLRNGEGFVGAAVVGVAALGIIICIWLWAKPPVYPERAGR